MYVSLLLSTGVSVECVPMSWAYLSADVYGVPPNHISPRAWYPQSYTEGRTIIYLPFRRITQRSSSLHLEPVQAFS